MQVLTVVGARPQFVKAGMVSRALAAEGVEEILVHTGQHYDAAMSDVFFEELQIPTPAHHLGIGSGLHGSQTGRMLEAIETVLLETKPDRLLVYGDTNSTLAGALAASKLHIPIDHVEAGLRSFNRTMPEEINRIVTDHVASLLFAPTETAITNLRNEGINEEQIIRSGDVMFDATLAAADIAKRTSTVLEDLALKPQEFILATAHRADNTDDPALLRAVFEGLAEAARTLPVVLPLHPRTKASLEREELLEWAHENLTITEPKGYMDMTHLEANASLIATDSGGVQKEAFFHQVPCVTLRKETEWVELVDLGWNTICNPASDPIAETLLARIGTQGEQARPYGDGTASAEIAAAIACGRVAIK